LKELPEDLLFINLLEKGREKLLKKKDLTSALLTGLSSWSFEGESMGVCFMHLRAGRYVLIVKGE